MTRLSAASGEAFASPRRCAREFAAAAGAPPHLRRRAVVQAAWRMACASWAGGVVLASSGCASVAGRFERDPFALGVASGAPTPDGFVLWTRLAPDPRRGDGGLAPEPIGVRWEVAEDDRFARVVRSGSAIAHPALAHAVHVEVRGLVPERWYHYRFMAGRGAGQAVSPVGRARTAPGADAMPARLRFAFASCQQYEQGFYGAYRHMAEEDLDLVVFLGDYIYESSWGRDRVRAHWTGEPKSLDDYRIRHAQYRSDADLQRMHASAPWLLAWDDHEVDNDYANDRAQDLDPAFLARRAAAYRAYFEHMPLRPAACPDGASMRMYDRHRFGRLAEFMVLDDRQHRSHQACPRPGRGGSNVVDVAGCPELRDPARSMLGAGQERWLDRCFAESRGRWNLIAQQTLFARADGRPGPGETAWTDGWDGYPAARQRLIDAMRSRRPSNPVVLGGDVHSNWVCDVKADFSDPRSAVVATEFCGTSITSQGRPQELLDRVRGENPHVRLAESTHRGYGVVTLTPERCALSFRVVESVKVPEPRIATRARFVVEAGRPGAVAG
ncbi:alkaline phosphatase D family protein [Burkholderiaceae bacterium FT117]|uniref:alkaline phosphatase D family protein n=1 Tax=Zeimonas sediminis TaxID=2944268 RepID=UPI002342CE63|nr:alkaline phosphatase D family protein [Zeimonas sediminis]MCM5570273.1 alkaline phosphatase D family protein [Zeimonas sediminis]